MRFNVSERVMLGIKRLRRYSRKFNDAMGTYTTPLHDESSHCADAAGEYAINCGLVELVEKPKPKPTELVLTANGPSRISANMSVREIVELKRKRKLSED